MTPDAFRAELEQSLGLLTDILGKPVLGFRAPEFSIVKQTLWALDVLAEYGLKYDSSIFPIAGTRYGIADFPREPVLVETGGGGQSLKHPCLRFDCSGSICPWQEEDTSDCCHTGSSGPP